MNRRSEYVAAVRALGGTGRDMGPVIRLLRDPSGLPHADWQELVALIAELLSTDEKLRQLAEVSEAGGISRKVSEKPVQVGQVSINPLVLRVRGNGKGRLKKGQGTEDTRRRWVEELREFPAVSGQTVQKPGEIPPLSGARGISSQVAKEIADALEPDVAGGRYRLELGQRGAGNIEGPEAGLPSVVIGEELHQRVRASNMHGALCHHIRRMARERKISQRTMWNHWEVYLDTLAAARVDMLRSLSLKK